MIHSKLLYLFLHFLAIFRVNNICDNIGNLFIKNIYLFSSFCLILCQLLRNAYFFRLLFLVNKMVTLITAFTFDLYWLVYIINLFTLIISLYSLANILFFHYYRFFLFIVFNGNLILLFCHCLWVCLKALFNLGIFNYSNWCVWVELKYLSLFILILLKNLLRSKNLCLW